MSNRITTPEFDDRFWATVDERVERVRDLTLDELGRAERDLLTEQPEAEVVPVFPAPFWNRVNKRAAKVREMALYELSDAEERLVNGPQAPRSSWRGRVPVPALLSRLPRPRRFGLPLGARTNTIGFVTAVMAVLLLLPQIAPIASLADAGKPRGPLAIFFNSDDPDEDDTPPSEKSKNAGGGSRASGVAEQSATADGKPSSTKSPEPRATTKSPGSAASSAAAEGSSADSETTEAGGAASAGTPEGQDGADSADGVSAAGAKPAAPANLLVTAIDDTSVRLRWRDQSDNESGFVIERSGEPAERRTTESNQKGFIWSGLTPNSDACFRAQARNDAGVSAWAPSDYRCVRTYESQPAGGPVFLQALACSNEGTLSSVPDVQETEITFRNMTGSAVKIFELGEGGVRELTPVRLEPGGATTVNTFLGNPYVVTRDDEAAGCIALFMGRSWTSVANIIEPA